MCGDSACKCYLNRKRQKKHYRKNIKDEDWRKALAVRKKKERQDRNLQKKDPDSVIFPETSASAEPERFISNSASGKAGSVPIFFDEALQLGFLGFFTGSKDYREIQEFVTQCRIRGAKFKAEENAEFS